MAKTTKARLIEPIPKNVVNRGRAKLIEPTNKLTPQVLVDRALKDNWNITPNELCDIIAIFGLRQETGGIIIDWKEEQVFIHALNATFSWKAKTGKELSKPYVWRTR